MHFYNCECGAHHQENVCPKCRAHNAEVAPPIPKRGRPGAKLEKIVPKFFSKNGCGCKSYARKMDAWGVDGCEKRFDEIVAHLVSQASKKRVVKYFGAVNRAIASLWLTQAITRAKEPANAVDDNGDWFVAITTAPRTGCTLLESIDSIRRAGWEPTIFAEPGSTATNCETITNETKKGVWHNWLSSARYAIDNTSAKLILTVQDDSLFHPDSRAFAESILWPSNDAGFVSLYTPKHYSSNKNGTPKKPGVNRINTRSLWGACAMVWHRDVLASVINHRIAANWVGARPKSGNMKVIEKRKQDPWRIANSDTAIGRIVSDLGKTMWFVDPSPVQHIATHSTISHGGNKGRRNCLRCADHSKPLTDQIPLRGDA